MNKLAYGLVAGLLIGSAFSDEFRQTIRDFAGRASRVAVTILQDLREGASAGADETQADARLRDVAASEPGNLLDRIVLDEKPASPAARPAQSTAKPEPPPMLDVTQIPAGKKTR